MLVRTGFYGNRESDAAHTIIAAAIQQMVDEGKLVPIPQGYEEESQDNFRQETEESDQGD